MGHFDLLEIREPAEREAEQFAELRQTLDFALGHAPGLRARLGALDPATLVDRSALARLPVMRAADLPALQAAQPPFGGLTTRAAYHFAQVFATPGPVFVPGGATRDWWRMGRFLHAAGFGMGDVILNCFDHHLTPFGHMMESGVAAISATVIPAGPGDPALLAEIAHSLGATGYLGAPELLTALLDQAAAAGRTLRIARAGVVGGGLSADQRQRLLDQGVACLRCYATADLGLIAFETEARDGMVVDEGVIVEILRPDGAPTGPGEVGEVVVTTLTPDYPLLRFATGDLAAALPGESPCGRTNMRLSAPVGRAG